MRMHQRKRRVIADRADVADVIGEPFKFRHQRPQENRASRDFDFESGFDSVGESERIGDRAVAGDAASETHRTIERRIDHQLLNAFVGIAEPLLQADDDLSISGKAKMPWLDNSGVDRANGNLM